MAEEYETSTISTTAMRIKPTDTTLGNLAQQGLEDFKSRSLAFSVFFLVLPEHTCLMVRTPHTLYVRADQPNNLVEGHPPL
jgi:hypothetical protein